MEIDSAAMRIGPYYRDDKCKEIERILQSDQRYMEWVVNRRKMNGSNDPYFFRDSQGKLMVVLRKWEIDTLDESELLSLIVVCRERTTLFSRIEALPYLLFGVLMILLMLLLSSMIYPTEFEWLLSVFTPGILILVAAIVISAFVSIRQRMIRQSRQREVDIQAAHKDPSFLSAIRKLADVPDGVYIDRERYKKRLKEIELGLTGTNY